MRKDDARGGVSEVPGATVMLAPTWIVTFRVDRATFVIPRRPEVATFYRSVSSDAAPSNVALQQTGELRMARFARFY